MSLFSVCISACDVHTVACMWKSEENLTELLLFFYHVNPSVELRLSALAAGTFTSEQSHLPVWFVTGSHSMVQAALELAM